MSHPQFLSHSSPPELLTFVLLHGRYPVLDELIQFVQHQLHDIACWLQVGKRYTAAQLMGSTGWDPLSSEEKRLCGSVIAHLAKEGQMPLFKCEKRSTGEVNSYTASPGAEAWLLVQLGVQADLVPVAIPATGVTAFTSPKE